MHPCLWVTEGTLKAKDWDRALLASYRSFSLQSAPLDLGAVRPPVLIIQVGWHGLLVIGLCCVVFDCCSRRPWTWAQSGRPCLSSRWAWLRAGGPHASCVLYYSERARALWGAYVRHMFLLLQPAVAARMIQACMLITKLDGLII